MKWVYKYDADSILENDWVSNLGVGDRVMVVSRTNVLSGKEAFNLDWIHAESGYPGNVDSSVKRFHGWRGTTGDVSIHAYGVYAVKSVDESGSKGDYKLRIELGHKDMAKYRP